MFQNSLFLTGVRTRFPNDWMWCYEVLGITNSHYITQIEGKLVVDHILKDFLISLPVYWIIPHYSLGMTMVLFPDMLLVKSQLFSNIVVSNEQLNQLWYSLQSVKWSLFLVQSKKQPILFFCFISNQCCSQADIKMWDMFVVGNWRKRGIFVEPVNNLSLDLSLLRTGET